MVLVETNEIQNGWNFGSVIATSDLVYFTLYTPFDKTPPAITILSPEKAIFSSRDVQLNFTLNEPVLWMGYSLDGQTNRTISENITLTDLQYGEHNVIFYAQDVTGNMGASKQLFFYVEVSFAITFVAVSVIVIIALGFSISAFYCFLKIRNLNRNKSSY